jgi:hypothetical protein
VEAVTGSLRKLVETKQRFTSVEAGWQRFLHYLHERMGADIDGVHRRDMATHLGYIDGVIDDPVANRDESNLASLERFGRYDDVIAAFQKFRVAQMLPAS